MTLLERFKPLFVKYCTNAYPAVSSTGDRQLYRRDDLNQWSKEAYECGEQYFCAEPVDPRDPHGSLHLVEPKYSYHLSLTLSEKEYKELFDETDN